MFYVSSILYKLEIKQERKTLKQQKLTQECIPIKRDEKEQESFKSLEIEANREEMDLVP